MPSADEVTHRDWTNTTILYDDARYSLIWANFRDEGRLGARWNVTSTSTIGFPSARGHPVCHVEPPFLEEAILHGAPRQLLVLERNAQVEQFIRNVIAAMAEARAQQG